MSRAVRRQNVGVALFPFLAVLICTMGALIVLLVLLVQQARVDASTIAAHQTGGPDQRELRERLEDAQWRRETLETSRAEKAQELADSRGKLTHLEDHLQRLQTQAQELIERARLIDQGSQLRADDLAIVREELQRVQAEVEKQKRKIEDAKRNAAKESWYALIPYDGPQGTRRRPIYIECTEQGVVVQPEGLVLRAQDFHGPLGPGNPLDAALRMIRAHLEQVHGAKAGQPYPLVIVRPRGVASYGAARSALKSWDDEFGYELIGDDKKLDFGVPDPALAAALEKTVAVARQKQAAIAAMMPRTFQDDEQPQSFAAEPPLPTTAGRAGLGNAGTGSRIGTGQGTAGGSTIGAGGQVSSNASSDGAYGGSHAANASLSRGNAARAGSSGTDGLGPGGTASSRQPDLSSAGPALGSPAGDATGMTATGGAGQFTPGRESTGNAAGNRAAGSSGSAAGQPTPPGGAAGGAGGGGAPATGQAGSQPVPNLPLGQASSKASSSSSNGATSANQSGNSKAGKSRGRNWALTGAKTHAIGVTRPLHVAVLADRLVIVPERGESRAAVVVPISPELRPGDVERFVTAVQREIQGWGLAVANGYWKPVLHVDVAASAEQQFAALRSALDGSGFDVVRKQP